MSVLRAKRAVHESPGEVGLAVLRVVAGFIMAAHGWAKLTDVAAWQAKVESLGVPAPEQLAWLAIAGELLGGAGLLVGLFTPVAALGVVATMATAIVQVHWGNGLFAKNGGVEYPLLMLSVAAAFMLRGGGPLSVDALIKYARRHTRGEPEEEPAPTVPSTHGPPLSDT